ncbi:hypothetical protein Enr17x_58610 [Gimesia fumaroli]|uniref:Uncharacterized protein n=1 Tax=Gimesia fumaroli TaxID=2527976 RepID=A0A518IL13_9PLAN|nr:hypothetical protein Enr17x_58610 [Gimesia fumaroli]
MRVPKITPGRVGLDQGLAGLPFGYVLAIVTPVIVVVMVVMIMAIVAVIVVPI